MSQFSMLVFCAFTQLPENGYEVHAIGGRPVFIRLFTFIQ